MSDSSDDDYEESVDSGEDSDTWNWRNAENNRLIIQLYKYDKEQDKRLDKLEQRLNGILSLLDINEVPETSGRDDDHDQLINVHNEHLNQPESEQPNLPMGGGKRRKRTRGKKRSTSRKKKRTRKRGKSMRKRKRTRSRK